MDKYTHFAVMLATGKIVDGWEYDRDLTKSDIRYYTSMDLRDNFPDNKLKEFKVYTRKTLANRGIDVMDFKNWQKVS